MAASKPAKKGTQKLANATTAIDKTSAISLLVAAGCGSRRGIRLPSSLPRRQPARPVR